MNNRQQQKHHYNNQHNSCVTNFNDTMLDEKQVLHSSSSSSEDSSSSSSKKEEGNEKQQGMIPMMMMMEQQQQSQQQQPPPPLPCSVGSSSNNTVERMMVDPPSRPLSVGETVTSSATTTTQHQNQKKIRPVFDVKDDYNEAIFNNDSSSNREGVTAAPSKVSTSTSTSVTPTSGTAAAAAAGAGSTISMGVVSSDGVSGGGQSSNGNNITTTQNNDNNNNNDSIIDNDDDIVDKIIVERLNNLSMEERQEGIHELHGVADTLEDLPSWQLKIKLDELSNACNVLVEGDLEETLAYRIALSLNIDYVQQIHLLCLKADYYDIDKAAIRCVNFFTYKMELFGKGEILGRDITLDDFDSDDMIGCCKGASQLIQERDRAGRGIILMNTPKLDEGTIQTCFRNIFYVTMVALRDVEIQKHGVAMVLWTLGQTKTFKGRPAKFARSLWFIPVRVVAVHYCYDTDVMEKASRILQEALESHHLCRYRNHTGSYQECMYNLMTFGIPKESFPINMETGKDDLQFHHNWIQIMKSRESSIASSTTKDGGAAVSQQQQQPPLCGSDVPTNTFSATAMADVIAPDGMTSGISSSNIDDHYHLDDFEPTLSSSSTVPPTDTTTASTTTSSDTNTTNIIIPGPMDIVMGRGSHSRKSQGNIRFRMILNEYYDKYNGVSRRERMQVACQVLGQIRQHGCRFIKVVSSNDATKNDDGGGEDAVQVLQECSADESIEKISHAFRNMRTANKKNNNRNQKQQHQPQQQQQQGKKQKPAAAGTSSAEETIMGSTGGEGPTTMKKKRRNSPSNSEYYDQFLGNIQPAVTPEMSMRMILEQQQQQQQQQQQESVSSASASYPLGPPSTSSPSASSFDDIDTMF